MEAIFKTPLSVYVLFDREYQNGMSVYEDIYHLLCRDAKRPLSDGLDIPVYCRTNTDGNEIVCIDPIESIHAAIILLVDENMYCNDKWYEYVDKLRPLIETKNVNLYAVSLCKYSYDISEWLKDIQFITLKEYDIRRCWTEFQLRLFDCLIRLITETHNKKINLFISHSKKDNDHKGELMAKSLRDYLRSDTKLDSFFDANDILDGYFFGEQIKNSICHSILIILETSTYSEREWCRIEAITGKEKHVPSIIVSLFDGITERVFPYLGNLPKIQFNGCWDEVVALALKTALKQYYDNFYLSYLKSQLPLQNTTAFPFAPELINLAECEAGQTVLYPEPPLGTEELSILSKDDKHLQFKTPSQLFYDLNNIDNKRIAISISEVKEAIYRGIGKPMFSDLSVELARHILAAGGQLVYGGDLRKDGFTELFCELSYQYGSKEKSDTKLCYFTNYFAWPIFNKLKKTDLAEFKHNRVNVIKVQIPECVPTGLRTQYVEPISNEQKDYWRHSLSIMRKQMEENVDARIILGGAVKGFKGIMPGIYEEALNAIEMHHPLFLLGGFGGAARRLIDLIEKKKTAEDLFSECQQDKAYVDYVSYLNEKGENIDFHKLSQFKDINVLSNGLNAEENERLFLTTNITEIIALILKGLSNV